MKHATVSLQLIVKDEYEQVALLLKNAVGFFDEINVTVSDKPTANKLGKILPGSHGTIAVKWREWTDDFAAARNDNFAMSSTDFTFWLDADDQFDFRAIPQLLEIATENNIDAIFLPYNYAQDENGNCIVRHWRERLVRNGKGFSWRGKVHETYITEEPYVSHKVDCEVKHVTAPGHQEESLERNHAILESAYAETEDPRYLHYLGMSYFTRKEYEQAISTLIDYVNVGGSEVDIYRSLSLISEAAYHTKNFEEAFEYATRCIVMKPQYPMGYYLLAQYEADQENWKEALEWVRVAMGKPDPDDNMIFDPTARERAILIAAQAEFMLKNYNAAHAWLKKIPNNKYAQDLMADFKKEAAAEKFIELLPSMRAYFNSDLQLWCSLVPDIRYDSRVRDLRYSATEPKKWNDKSIVIFCGQGYEEWGPHTMDKGMGGSEEAVIYLSEALSNLGYHVTVFAEYDSKGSHLVDWRPWKEIDVRDEFNVFVSWRAPQFLERINAKVKLADIHDVLPEDLIKNYPDVTYLFKSEYHKGLYGDVDSRVIGNGIKKDQFRENS